MTDWVPGISQLKSVVQLVCGDREAAWQTQQNFFRKCPGVSHVVGITVGAIGILTDNEEYVNYGTDAIFEGTMTIGDIADGIPLIGHAKAGVHHLSGNTKRRDKAILSANRSAVVMGGGAVGFIIFGPVGAVSGGVIGGIIFDGYLTVFGDGPRGIWALRDRNSAGDIFDAVFGIIGDGLAGYAAGKKLDQMLRAKEIKALENIKKKHAEIQQRRVDSGLEPYTPEQLDGSVWTEVTDLETQKTYYGTNQKFRTKAKLSEPRNPNPNLFVENNPVEGNLPIDRPAQTCAEAHAMHQLLMDNPTADLTITRVNTFVYRDGQFRNIGRCDNCLSRAHVMGPVPTDPLTPGINIHDVNVMNMPGLPSEFYENNVDYMPENWYTQPHTILTNADYANRINLGLLGAIFRPHRNEE